MANEISWSTTAFFNGGARNNEMSFGRICPFEFPDGVRRQMPEQILLTYFSGSEYEWLFMGTFWERLQTVEQRKMKCIWRPDLHNNPWVEIFVLIIHYTIQLIEREEDDYIQ